MDRADEPTIRVFLLFAVSPVPSCFWPVNVLSVVDAERIPLRRPP